MNSLKSRNSICILLSCVVTTAYPSLAREGLITEKLSQESFFQSDIANNNIYDKQQLLLIDKESNYCQSINSEYQQLYNFETLEYNIGICYKDKKWFYYRQSKSNPDNFLFLPAQIVFGGDVFKATDKKVTYFVGINSSGYYSSVMYGNNQIVFEPPISSNSTLIKNKTTINPEVNLTPKTVNVQDTSVINFDLQ